MVVLLHLCQLLLGEAARDGGGNVEIPRQSAACLLTHCRLEAADETVVWGWVAGAVGSVHVVATDLMHVEPFHLVLIFVYALRDYWQYGWGPGHHDEVRLMNCDEIVQIWIQLEVDPICVRVTSHGMAGD